MIDTGKLLTNRSNRSTNLSRKSVINIGLIREDVIKIDGMLKMRLVLSKVREGIERQNEERLKRKSREEELERDDDRDDDDNRRRDPDPKPKKGGGLIGFLIGGVIAIVGALALRFLPTIFKILGFIKKIAKPLTLVISGAFLALTRFISVFNEKTNQLQGIDRDEIKVSRIERTVNDFSGALDAFVTSLIIGGALSMGMKVLRGRNAKTVVRDLKRQETNVRRTNLNKIIKKRRGRPQRSIIDIMADIDERSPTKPGQFTGKPVPLKQKVRPKPKPKPIIRSFRPQDIDFGLDDSDAGRIRFETEVINDIKKLRIAARENLTNQQTGRITDDVFEIRRLRIIEDLKLKRAELEASRSKRVRFKQTGVVTNQEDIARRLGLDPDIVRSKVPKELEGTNPLKTKRLPPSSTVQNQQTQQPQGSGRRVKVENFFEDPRGGPGAMKINKALLKQRGGIVKVLSNIGGDGFVQTFKQGLKGSIGIIPILGDVFGFLLDYFVFGEPIGRAAFKAVGSFALSSLIGAVGLALGGPVGAFIGSVIGGIGGDILGGIAYDLFFGKERRTSPKSSATKAVVKGATQAFEKGGFVGPEPSFKPLVNNDRSTDLRVTASYDKPSAGRVKFIPIPLPIPSREQPQEEQIAMNNTTTKTRTFAGLYQR